MMLMLIYLLNRTRKELGKKMSPLSPQLKETLVEQHQRLLVETDSYVELIRAQKEQVAKLEAKV